jgi:dTDP-4-amino-4,6-dideoxygalactose transaminase
MIPCAHPKAQYLARKSEIDAAVARVLTSGSYILGGEVAAFEDEFATFIGETVGDGQAMHGIGVASGTDAVHLALRACGIGPGDEVITTAFTAVGTVAAIEHAGSIPVFADIEPGSLTLDPVSVERVITPKTRAIIPVHLYGGTADMDPLLELARRHGLRLIEDCAQAHGARYRGTRAGRLGARRVGARAGSYGDFGCFSCYPTKNLGALGDAGILVTRDPALADNARRLRQYGWDEHRNSQIPGLNSRLDAVQAAVLRVKLPFLDADNAARARIAAAYDAAFADRDVILPLRREGDVHVYHLYTLQTPRRDALRSFLAARGIETRVHYEMPVHLQSAYRGRIIVAAAFANGLPVTERAAGEVLSLPMYPQLRDDEVEAVIGAVRAFTLAS